MGRLISGKGHSICAIFSAIFISLTVIGACAISVNADEKTESLNGKLYEFEKGSKYEISLATSSKSTAPDFGSLKITGNMNSISAMNGVNAYEVLDGNVNIDYSLENKYSGENTDSWYLIDDKSKKIDTETIEEDIMKGAIIFQISLDGNSWVTDKVFTNVAADPEYESNIYISNDIQQVNGCYYRVIVAYSLERVTGSSKYVFVNVDNKENKKCAEVYQFYLINSSENISNGVSASATPRKELGEVVNAGKDTGFSENNALKNKDPHYGWTIGTFFVNGYTREVKDNISGTPIFLKNVGDRVTLWFNLKQDINNLNGKSNLRINEDKNGYDQYFQTDKTNMRHGTLIIRYTDFEGVKHDPVIYTDYLAANARTGADTKVELFEEGDYEVALDYEIADTSGIDSYTDYRVFFTFSIRNGNCMVYPFDINSGAELADNAITENGFKLDMAKSRYLTIDVSRTVLVNGTNGRTEDVRFNRPAKDGDQYKDEGIYRFHVHNLYTGEETTKTIYVGSDMFLRAMSATHLSVKELEDRLAEGYTIGNDGRLIDPPIEETETVPVVETTITEEKQEKVAETKQNLTEAAASDAGTEGAADTVADEEVVADIGTNGEPAAAGNQKLFAAAAAAAAVAFVFIFAVFVISRKSRKKGQSSKMNTEASLEGPESGKGGTE